MREKIKKNPEIIISAIVFETPLGLMVAIASGANLCRVEFIDAAHVEALRQQMPGAFEGERTAPLISLVKEINSYFNGTLTVFTTPIFPYGTDFQRLAWQQLMRIPYGQTQSYKEQAAALKKPTAFRAVANANGRNPLVIIIPCHRVVSSCGGLGGYSAGIERKQRLLEHERKYAKQVIDAESSVGNF